MSETAIEMIGVNKWFGDFHVLKDINLTVNTGQRMVICGPSGSGKSTVVRSINRLEVHQKGTIRVDGIELTDDAASVAASTAITLPNSRVSEEEADRIGIELAARAGYDPRAFRGFALSKQEFSHSGRPCMCSQTTKPNLTSFMTPPSAT